MTKINKYKKTDKIKLKSIGIIKNPTNKRPTYRGRTNTRFRNKMENRFSFFRVQINAIQICSDGIKFDILNFLTNVQSSSN